MSLTPKSDRPLPRDGASQRDSESLCKDTNNFGTAKEICHFFQQNVQTMQIMRKKMRGCQEKCLTLRR